MPATIVQKDNDFQYQTERWYGHSLEHYWITVSATLDKENRLYLMGFNIYPDNSVRFLIHWFAPTMARAGVSVEVSEDISANGVEYYSR